MGELSDVFSIEQRLEEVALDHAKQLDLGMVLNQRRAVLAQLINDLRMKRMP